MRKMLLLLIVLGLSTSLCAAWQSVVGSKHDLSTGGTADSSLRATNTTWVCTFCHTPHQPSSMNSQHPLWNHARTATATFGVYSSPTMNATPSDIGGAAYGAMSMSLLCMSCHDGTVGMGNVLRGPGDISGHPAPPPSNSTTLMPSSDPAYIGASLTNDHPVNFTYDNNLYLADGGLVDPASPAVAQLLFANTMQCSSCHDAHNDGNSMFLVKDNAGSALCTTCHHK